MKQQTRSAFRLGLVAWVALLARPAAADDISVYSSKPVPPNLVWVMDSSGSMNNLPCRENPYASSQVSCFTPPWTATAPRDMNLVSMTVSGRAVNMCLSTTAQALGYVPATTYPNPDPDFGGGGGPMANFAGTTTTKDDIYEGSLHNSWGVDYNTIADYCTTARFPNCEQRSRCIYSLETYGYFFEHYNCVGSGDPKGICPATTANQNFYLSCAHTPGTKKKVNVACAAETECGCRDTDSNAYDYCVGRADGTRVCHECDADDDCGGGNNRCYADARGVKQCIYRTPEATFTGNFLNFYPPKYVVARRVFREVLSDTSTGTLVRQRMALMTYDGDSGGGKLERGMNPPCNQLCFDDTCNSNFTSNRGSLINKVDSMSFNTGTPLGETADDIGCYFNDGQSGNGLNNACQLTGFNAKSNSSAYTNGNFPNTGPVCLACQRNFAIMITDGIPSGDGDGDLELSGATGATDPEGYVLPEVTKYIFERDLNPVASGTQNVVSYMISFGATDPTNAGACAGVLARGASAGDGKCLAARDADALKAAILAVLTEIDSRVRAFTAPAVQASRGEGESNANLAVFKADETGPLWQGHLYSFDLWEESLRGNSAAGASSTANEILVLDANAQKVTFDQEGNLLSKPYWDAQLCLSGDVSNTRGAMQPEDIHNVDVASCYRSASESAGNGRKIYTQFTTAWTTTPPTPDLFTEANIGTLGTKFGGTATEVTRKIIRFFRGYDMLDRLGNGSVSTPIERNLTNFGKTGGWWKLGSIFHSAPTLVGTGEFLGTFKTASATTGSYEQWFADNRTRSRQIIVGADDGMIHSFDAGTAQTGDDPSTSIVEPSSNVYYTSGTGAENWAFIPPHHLPQMGTQLSCPNNTTDPCTVNRKHDYYVDGSPQVRDIYIGKDANKATCTNLSDPSKSIYWKTVAVLGDRDGGSKFTALDVTVPNSPKYLWEFPNTIGTGAKDRAEVAGNSWSDHLPSPSPIFPVKFDVDGVAGGDWYFRWVTVVNGGFKRDQLGGRGIYMLDAYTGELLWKWEKGSTGERQFLNYSFAAPVAGVRANKPSDCGPFIDTLVAVDTGGQVWRFDISSPGVVTTAALAQWTGERVFASALASATSAAYPALPAGTSIEANEYPYRPMFGIPAIARDQDGEIWAYVGTGDRDLLTNPGTAHPSGTKLHGDIAKMVCAQAPYDTRTYFNRIYALKLKRAVAGTVNDEDDLSNLTQAGTGGEGLVATAAAANKSGWFLILRPGEKVNNPADVFFGVSYFTTYQPTAGCNIASSSANSCEAPAGVGRLYALDYIKGTPALNLDNTDSGTTFGSTTFSAGLGAGTLSSADTSKGMGAGMPTAPTVSVGMGQGRGSATLLISSSQDPSPVGITAKAPSSLVQRVFEILIPNDLHKNLTTYGSEH